MKKSGTHELVAKLIVALNTRSHTYEELAVVCGISERAAMRWVNTLRAAGLVNVHEWKSDSIGRPIVPCFIWTIAGETDAPRPKRR